MLFRLVSAHLLVAFAAASCQNGQWNDDYCPERCQGDGDFATITCSQRQGSECGNRVSSYFRVGKGMHAMRIQAAPGEGVVTSYYLSNNGGLYDKTKTHPWVEIDYELMGYQAVNGKTHIWTNMLTGIAVEHWKMIEVPFDITEDMHTYAIEITDHHINWIVDGVKYRTENMTNYPDVQWNTQHSQFQTFLSLWGKTSYDAPEGILEFRQAMGVLDRNKQIFPVHARFDRSQAFVV